MARNLTEKMLQYCRSETGKIMQQLLVADRLLTRKPCRPYDRIILYSFRELTTVGITDNRECY